MSVTAVSNENGNKVELTITGRFDFNQHSEFRNGYRNENPGADYIVNMKNADYLDSSALGMLLLLREHAGSENAKISIINTPAEIKKIFKNANFESLFKISWIPFSPHRVDVFFC